MNNEINRTTGAQILAGVPLRPGLILNMSCRSPYGPWIRMSLAPAYERLTHDPHPIVNCPSHSAMIVENDGQLWVGEAERPVAVLTSIAQYAEYLRTGHVYNLCIMEVVGATPEQECAASRYWIAHVLGTKYNRIAMPRLLLKAIFGDLINTPCGVPWEHWCTQSNMEAWRDGAHLDPFQNLNPTPLTELKRLLEGKFRQLYSPAVFGH